MITTIAVIGVVVVIALGIPLTGRLRRWIWLPAPKLLAADRRPYAYQSRLRTITTTAMAVPPISAQLSTVSATKMSHRTMAGV